MSAAPARSASSAPVADDGPRARGWRTALVRDLPESLPKPPDVRSAGFASRDTTPLVYVGTIGSGSIRQAVGYESLAQLAVTGGFEDALAAAHAIASSRPEARTRYLDGNPDKPGIPADGDDPARWQRLDETTPTTVAAVLQAVDGRYFVAPVFAKSFDDGARYSAFGVDLPKFHDDRFPVSAEGRTREIVALVSPTTWSDLRPESQPVEAAAVEALTGRRAPRA